MEETMREIGRRAAELREQAGYLSDRLQEAAALLFKLPGRVACEVPSPDGAFTLRFSRKGKAWELLYEADEGDVRPLSEAPLTVKIAAAGCCRATRKRA